MAKPNPYSRALKTATTFACVAVVAWFVRGAVSEAWRQLTETGVQLNGMLLALSGLVYLVALTPMAWYWRRVVMAVDRPVGWLSLLAAYFAGHLGKYVPGKAMVVVIRTAMLRRLGGETGPLAASVAVETLTMMATGAAIAAVLLGVGVGGAVDSPWLFVAAIGMALLAATPTLPPVLERIVGRLANAPPPRLSWRLLATGWLAASVTWLGLSLSLWLAVIGCGGQLAASTDTVAALLLATTLPYVAGFLSLIPGGLLVRDGLMLTLLVPIVGESTAFAATAATRLVWIAAELTVYTGLYVVGRLANPAPPNPTPPAEPPTPAAPSDP